MMNEETSLSDKFNHVEAVINELENGSTAKETVCVFSHILIILLRLKNV